MNNDDDDTDDDDDGDYSFYYDDNDHWGERDYTKEEQRHGRGIHLPSMMMMTLSSMMRMIKMVMMIMAFYFRKKTAQKIPMIPHP